VKYTNIITVEKERSSKGQWLNNLYILLDKSEWKKPEELKDLWKTRGTERPNQRNLTTEPEELKAPLRIQIKKDTNKKDTNKEICLLLKKWNDNQSSPLEAFKPENIVNKYGVGKVEKLVKEYGQSGGFLNSYRH